MEKLADLEKDERRNIEEELESISSSMGMEIFDSHSGNFRLLKDLIGMCYNCKCLKYCRTEFGNVYAFCETFEFKLSGQNRIVECNMHSPKGVLTLNEMYNIAWLIDKDDGKKTEGFLSTNPKLMKKKE